METLYSQAELERTFCSICHITVLLVEQTVETLYSQAELESPSPSPYYCVRLCNDHKAADSAQPGGRGLGTRLPRFRVEFKIEARGLVV